MGSDPELYHLPAFYEPFSSFSHFLGAIFFLAMGMILLARGRRHRPGVIYLAIYVASVLTLLIFSGMYHMPPRGSAAQQFIGRLDHGAIFLLIAGSFTPPHGILMRGWLRWGPLVGVWTVATAGILMKTIFYDDLPEWLLFVSFISVAWFGIVTGWIAGRRYGIQFVKPLIFGGIAYTAGGFFDFFQYPILIPGMIHGHELMHIAVLIGIFYHWVFIWQFAAGEPRPKQVAQPQTECVTVT
jgi:channel protein (hemolysin III family)